MRACQVHVCVGEGARVLGAGGPAGMSLSAAAAGAQLSNHPRRVRWGKERTWIFTKRSTQGGSLGGAGSRAERRDVSGLYLAGPPRGAQNPGAREAVGVTPSARGPGGGHEHRAGFQSRSPTSKCPELGRWLPSPTAGGRVKGEGQGQEWDSSPALTGTPPASTLLWGQSRGKQGAAVSPGVALGEANE